VAQIQTKFIANSAVTEAKIASDAVTTVKIADSNVTNAKVASGIDAAKLADGSVSNTEFQYLNGVTSALQTQLDAKVDESREGAANGIATLDAGGKVPASQLPNSVMEYLGTWAASTNTPTLANGTGNAGDVYIASDGGTVNFGAGNITFIAGDWVIYSGSIWQKSVNSNSVVSVNGQTGVVNLTTNDIFEATELYFTDERAQDAVGTILVDTASVDLAYNDGTPSITATVLPGGVDHDALLNYVANDHIDHSAVSINTATDSGLGGGGDITATRSLIVNPTNAPSVSAATGDQVLIADASDSNNLKRVSVDSIAALASAGANTTLSNLVSPIAIPDTVNLLPANDVQVNLGSDTKRFNSAYLSDIRDADDDVAINVSGRQLMDELGNPIVYFDSSLTRLVDSGGLNVMQFATGQRRLYDTGGNESVEFTARQLKSTSTVKLDWSGTNVSLNTRKLIDVVNPTAAQDAATKDYVDTGLSGKQATGNYITALTGDVAASGPGSAAATLATVNSNVGSFTNANITVDAKGRITAASNGSSASTNRKATFTLVSGDITNQYVDLSFVARTDSISLSVSGVAQYETADYTVNYTGGAGGNTRVTFAGDLATAGAAALIAGDVLNFQFES
jgi:hypothetical protein